MFDPRSYFLDNASDYASVFQQSLISHPTAKQFIVAPGRTEKAYSFVPTHLKRLLPNNCPTVLTIDRPVEDVKDLKTYLSTKALLALADMSKAETLKQAVHRVTEETAIRTVFKDIVELIEKAEKRAPRIVGRLTRHYDQMRDYYFDRLETARHNAKVTCPGLDVVVSDNRRDVGIGLNGQLLDTDSEAIIMDWLHLTDKDLDALPDAIYTSTLVKVDRLATCVQHLAGAISSAKRYDSLEDHSRKLLRLQHELSFEIEHQEQIEKDRAEFEETMMNEIFSLTDRHHKIRDEENTKEGDDA